MVAVLNIGRDQPRHAMQTPFKKRPQGPLSNIQEAPTTSHISPNNRIHDLFNLYRKYFSDTEISQAYQVLDKILGKMMLATGKLPFSNQFEQAEVGFQELKKHFTIIENGSLANNSIMQNLLSGVLDCDSSSFVMMTLADELHWKNVFPIAVGKHLFLSINGRYLDFGKEKDYAYYFDRFPLSPGNITSQLEPLKDKSLQGEYYYNVAAAIAERPGLSSEALILLEKARSYTPQLAIIPYTMARIHHLLLSNPRRAVLLYKKTLQITPYFSNAWFQLGEAYESSGENSLAIDAFRQAKSRLGLAFSSYSLIDCEKKLALLIKKSDH